MLPPYYLLKVIAAAVDTPLAYLGVGILKRFVPGIVVEDKGEELTPEDA